MDSKTSWSDVPAPAIKQVLERAVNFMNLRVSSHFCINLKGQSTMDHKSIIEQLEENIALYKSLLMKVTKNQVHWKPSPEKWSLLEVVNHLYDEEREDFRYRLRSVLENPSKAWPPIAPEEWVRERGYSNREYTQSVSNFLYEREESIKWLRQLSSPDWQASHHHPQIGLMSAEMILANWLAHDCLHIRQILALKYGNLVTSVKPISLEYAGSW